ncbi:MAG: hypothetical protein ABIS67_05690, partial [Candidatus Eisenbacteria bacterium]
MRSSRCHRHDARLRLAGFLTTGFSLLAPLASGAPVGTGPPNVPEFRPAFPGQTRAPAVTTRTPLEVSEIAAGFDKPWAIA